jgi:transaldolase
MVIYGDTASIAEMGELAGLGVKGFTTNPTLARKAGVKDYEDWARRACAAFPDFPISLEVIADDPEEMCRQAELISSWGPNVWVKIPITTTSGMPTKDLLQWLWKQNIKVNITAVMTSHQLRWLAGTHGFGRRPTIVSIFAGRIADTGVDPASIIDGALPEFAKANVKILWASTRQVADVYKAEALGCDIITCTPDIIKKLSLRGKDLAQYSRETVQMFFDDAHAAGYKL